MIEPHGLVKMCGRNPSTLTIAAAEGPYAKPATRQTMPDGSYLSHGAAPGLMSFATDGHHRNVRLSCGWRIDGAAKFQGRCNSLLAVAPYAPKADQGGARNPHAAVEHSA